MAQLQIFKWYGCVRAHTHTHTHILHKQTLLLSKANRRTKVDFSLKENGRKQRKGNNA
jgi:hypothetical protein